MNRLAAPARTVLLIQRAVQQYHHCDVHSGEQTTRHQKQSGTDLLIRYRLSPVIVTLAGKHSQAFGNSNMPTMS